MYILLWLLFGALVGWLASIVMKKNHRMGLIANIVFGLVGSALGMWLMDILGFGNVNAFTLTGLLVSVGGAALLIAVFNSLSRR
ncbi:MAG: hypothetical protein A2Y45_08760 [Tenericutes bacterium GWC2_34_14]|nr:MAG: hypothetical protein A2Z84_04630 [Tenericutes bacterium GWA2_35_7]OHE29983.1 MAG: hypothetical protein A2Y45_08760 [Tenericutes bacterium GWC2_34_14]OHE34962.1 MAG: hypothetical protein A2012_02370 [Tenericutes bacterium GWE2_34_108]OHE37178.1 MAG: hypothetical protein A2Y46_00640 [Tenericutes bacterium GWF1_35_14]OHE39690.1 MAG: hypothetical protein A2Y44_02220 [Tenericutes bacterium GWF2_35_184]OHE44122.1 MAG: hypothetical protein A2221_03290 [Tenericutes bacterium RIFOXYA2_FULL_36_3